MSHKSGYIALAGKPNAGKSTLLNAILGSKLSIVTPKAQTTRHQITGIYSDDDSQIIFLDTPGLIETKYKLQEMMMRFAERARKDADVILLLVDPAEADITEVVEEYLTSLKQPLILVINKIDQFDEDKLASVEQQLSEQLNPVFTARISALQGVGVAELMDQIKELLPEGPPYYPPDQLSEHPVRFFAAELIREQVFLQFHQEIPYSVTVEIVQYDSREDMDYINAEIIVNRKSQKGILIGKGGSAIKKLGAAAREGIEQFVGRKVYLDLHVKVREKWREKENMLRYLGYK
ncbi:MAG: GTPase Era [Bacteroidota bacterium]